MTQKTIGHASASSVGVNIKPKAPCAIPQADAMIKALDTYFFDFADSDGKCPNCGVELSGLLGSFQWGLAHGEGFCSCCKWPARAYHRPQDADGEYIFDGALTIALAYHPDFVKTERVG